MDYLAKFKKLDIKTKKMISSHLAGNFRSAFKGKGLEFEEFKEYEAGEDSKYIDWLVSAREQRLLTKKFAIDKSIKVFFVLDTGESMKFGFEKLKQETMTEIFFLLALSSIENGDQVGALIFNENNNNFFVTKKGKAQVFEIYKRMVESEKNIPIIPTSSLVIPAEAGIYKKSQKSLSNIEANANNHFIDSGSGPEGRDRMQEGQDKGQKQSLRDSSLHSEGQNGYKSKYSGLLSTFSFLNKIKLKNTLLFVLTDKMDIEDDKNLKILALKNDVVFVNIFDNFENTLDTSSENSGVLGFLSDDLRGLFIDNLDSKKKDEYKKLRKSKIKNLSRHLNSIGVSYLKIDNLTNIYKEFFNFFSKK